MKKQEAFNAKPIDEYIEPFKRKSAVHYGFHGYFTTQPFNVVQAYIRNFTNEHELVADPFVGAGVTAVEALRLSRKCFALDLNPFAVFLTKTKCSYADIEKLTGMFHAVLERIEDECEAVEGMTQEEAAEIDIPYWYPSNVGLPSDSDVPYLHQIFTRKQLFQLSLIKSQIDRFPDSEEKDLLLVLFCGTLSRANTAYSLPEDGRSIYSGDFTIFHTGRYRIPKRIAEIPVLPVFKRRFLSIIKAKRETNADFEMHGDDRALQLVLGSATNLRPYLADSSVDYVYTDPPYGGHIRYLDLSTIYNAWLGFEVTEEMRAQEAIEGGERKHTFQQYTELIRESLSEISRVLRKDRWLSLIYHYREPHLWTNIVETAKKVGLEYRNSVVQHTKLPSWHKLDAPQTVLSSQMIINFQRKTKAHFDFSQDRPTLKQLIFNVAEREIIKRDGATLEDIINALIPELFEHNYIDDEAQTRTDKIFNQLAEEFHYNEEAKAFEIDRTKSRTLGSYIPLRDRVSSYLISFMRKKLKATLEEIIPYILPKVLNGETPSGQQILEELRKIAHFDGHYWVFKVVDAGLQPSFDLDIERPTLEPEIPHMSQHDQMIYRLAMLASKYGFIPKIGNQEQKEPFLKATNQCTELNFTSIGDKDNSYINNIDCLWMAQSNARPIYAFEVEHSTNIRDAFERFLSLLKIADDLGYRRNLVMVISRANRRKFDTAIRHSSYIGAPHYLNNKIRYVFEEVLASRFNELLREEDHTKFDGILSSPELG